MNKIMIPVVVGVIFFLSLATVCAEKNKLIIVSENSLEGNYDKKEYKIAGKLEVKFKDISMAAFGMTYWKDKKIAILNGPLKLIYEDGNICAELLEFNFEEEKGIFQGPVIVQRSEDKEKKREAFALYSNRFIYWAKSKDFTAEKGARIIHEDFNGFAKQIDYQNSKQEVTLTGDAVLLKPEGDKISGEKIQINLKAKTIEVWEKVKVQFLLRD